MFRGVPEMNTVMNGGVPALCENAPMAWQSHPTASAGDRVPSPNQRPTVVDGLWSFHMGLSVLCFTCRKEPVRLTELFRATRTPPPLYKCITSGLHLSVF